MSTLGFRERILPLFFAISIAFTGILNAQTATSGLVSGVVSDTSGAVIPNASVVLKQRGTNATTTANTDASGHYVFPAVQPSDYMLTITAAGFQTHIVQTVHVEVQKAYNFNVSMKVGNTNEVVEVTDVPTAELQTTTATVGTVLGGVALENLPQFTRSASALMFYQPAVSPGGQISGARDEQVTFSFDGGDVTSDLEGSNSYATPPGEPNPAPSVPVPIESTQEFQVSTSNPNATFGRSSGGQVSLMTKAGTNNYHGTIYEYNNNDGLNANGFTNNSIGLKKPHSVDNRFGGTIGGPIIKNRLWFFTNYEGRRLHSPTTFSFVVPTASLRSGILKFRDKSGTIVSYSLQPGSITTACGGVSCDPRNLGASPVVLSQLGLYPAGNDPSLGDGLNTMGYTFNAATPITQDLAVMRLDYKFSDRWTAFVTGHYSNTDRVSTAQISLLGTPGSVSGDPIKPQFYTFQVTGQINDHLTSVSHGSFLRNWWAWNRVAPTPLVSGTQEALVLAGEGSGNSNATSKLVADPVNLATQAARYRVFDGKKYYLAEDLSLVHNNHLFQFGGSWYMNKDYFIKSDNFAGGLTAGPMMYVESTGNGSGLYMNMSSKYQPTVCGTSSSNCIQSTDLLRWNELYSSLLGLVDRSSQVITRDGQFQPNPVGTPAVSQPTMLSYSSYFQDVWKMKPSLTLTLGVNWTVQPDPTEANGKYGVLVYASNNQPVDYWDYFAKRAASLNGGVQPGQAYNPLFGSTPVNSLPGDWKGKFRVTNWHQFAPRVAAAWNVPFKNWFFGDNKTVIRGGYSLSWDRMSDINQVSLPLTVGGLLDASICGGPVLQGSSVVCTNAATNPATAFRIGADGANVPVPTPGAAPIPYVPSGTTKNPFGLFVMSGLDPYAVPAHSHAFDLTIQRELPHRVILEVGYIGRLSRNLPQDVGYNAADYLMKDAASGQTFAQAFDAVATALRAGTAITATQPFFENQIGTASCAARGFTSCTAMVAAEDKTDLINGSLNNFALNEFNRRTPVPVDNIQSFQTYGITDHGFSTYHAGFVSVNKSLSNGLQLQANWTWSHAIGNQGVDQQSGSSANSPYNLNLDKASEPFDRRHVVNLWWYYELPFGKGTSGLLKRVIGGWANSGIFTYYTGTPMHIVANGDYGAWEGNGTAAICSANLLEVSGLHSGVAGSGGIGTSSKTGLNQFADPAGVYNSCSRPLLSINDRVPFDQLRDLPRWNTDFSVIKNMAVTERVKFAFSAEFLNIFNIVQFRDPTLNLNSKSSFGVLSTQANAPRRILLGMKLSF